MNNKRACPSRSGGFTLLEVVVGLAIAAVALVGLFRAGSGGLVAVDTAARYGGRYEDIPRRIPDSTKAQRELGWRLRVDVEEGIRRTIEWARANQWYLKDPAEDEQ